ncbi:hypothetical protein CR513_32699, partial [Mucuna pruriens]
MSIELKFFLGLQIKQVEDGIYIHQTKYFNLDDYKSMYTLIHLTSILTLDDSNKKVDQSAYIGTTNLGLWFKKSDKYKLKGYYDVDYDGDQIERKNISGGCHFI